MEEEALQPNALEQEVIDLVAYHLHGVEERLHAGRSYADDAERARELRRVAEVVQNHIQQRHERMKADEDPEPDPNLPPTMEGKLRQLKKFQDYLTTVQPDGSTKADKVKDQQGVKATLLKGAELHKTMMADLRRQQKLEAAAVSALEQLRDALLLWKVQSNTFNGGTALA